ncbi:sarcosine oxidase subunit gamma [Rhodalgimonas zhirmunskyi]|uniref:Sarcosine oxidase subunit gamma n=1 Tax=Rhodalgimonas zhirmunskyi TaxID=2964767 RepID=A0AAJ1U422_9RHOB|nr:sarcosine oxidase subunit gamma family protein [Rhodoalgimonas zhirmunskyi]MDQ2093316.1 sarcosine oxidase subunit gamma [Rhodoalgimonas zhirmunskyi]
MSEPQSALTGTTCDGIAKIREVGLQGMITLRGDLSATEIASAIADATGCALPALREITHEGRNSVSWMSPDEVMVFVPYDEAEATAAKLESALTQVHALVVNVSDARAMFELEGPNAREVLGKLCPVDLSPDSFGQGIIRRTRLAQVPAAFWMTSDASFRVVCFRSVAQYVFDTLKIAAQPGSEVGLYTQANG